MNARHENALTFLSDVILRYMSLRPASPPPESIGLSWTSFPQFFLLPLSSPTPPLSSQRPPSPLWTPYPLSLSFRSFIAAVFPLPVWMPDSLLGLVSSVLSNKVVIGVSTLIWVRGCNLGSYGIWKLCVGVSIGSIVIVLALGRW